MRQRAPAAIVSSVRDDHRGLVYGVTAYSVWGVFPLYFESMAPADAVEVVAYWVPGALLRYGARADCARPLAPALAVVSDIRACGLLTGASLFLDVRGDFDATIVVTIVTPHGPLWALLDKVSRAVINTLNHPYGLHEEDAAG